MGLPFIPPELREGRGEVAAALGPGLPRLVELGDIKGDLHMHTTASDGRDGLDEMVEGARRRGYEYVAITEHTKRATIAGGLDVREMRAHWRAVERLAARTKGLTVLKGAEVDILEDGSLDLPDHVLREADWIVASLHYRHRQTRKQLTKRLIKAIENPYVGTIGHPTGRLIGRRPPCDLDLPEVLKAAADHGCALELDGQPDRLDLDEVNAASAKAKGIPIVLDSDAHSVRELGFMEGAVDQARRAGLTAADVANTRSFAELSKLIRH